MKKLALVLLLMFCASCASWTEHQEIRPSVQVPRKDKAQVEEEQEAPGQELPEPERAEQQAAELNQRLQKIIAESPVRAEAEIFAPDSDQPDGAQQISFNFYDADLVEVVRVFMELLQEDYILHPEVQGRVSLSVEDEFYPEQIMDLLRGVLRVNNMAMIRGEEVWEVLPQSQTAQHLGAQELIFPDTVQKPKRGQIIQGFRLQYIAAEEMINIIKPYLSQSAQVYAHEQKGVLLVSDYPHVLEKIAELIRQFDESVFADVQAQVFPLRQVQAQEAVDQLELIAENFGLGQEGAGPGHRVSFLALERLNMVLAVTRDEQVLEFVETWIQGLDQEQPKELRTAGREEVFVYYVQYGDAQEIVQSLQGVFDYDPQQDKEKKEQEPEDNGQEGVLGQGRSSVSRELSGAVSFNVDETTNAIIIRCNVQDYNKIISVVEKLDLYPKQVLIEVVIAEVTLKDTTRLGVDWRYLLSLDGLEGEIEARAGADTPGAGVTFSLESSNRLQAALDAAVEDNQLQILSTPTLLASDNKIARINIGDQVPFPTSTRTRLDETDTSEVIDTTIQYRDTGIILEVTPKINKQGMVRMEIQQEVSNLSSERVQGIDAPVINTRHTSTNLAVGDQETVVIAGLMTQQRSRTSSGVPGLHRVPGLKHFFGSSKDEFENTELLVFITPHVILSQEDSNFLTRNFLDRLERVKKEMD